MFLKTEFILDDQSASQIDIQDYFYLKSLDGSYWIVSTGPHSDVLLFSSEGQDSVMHLTRKEFNELIDTASPRIREVEIGG